VDAGSRRDQRPSLPCFGFVIASLPGSLYFEVIGRPAFYRGRAPVFRSGRRPPVPRKSSSRMIDKLKKKLGEEAERLQHELNITLPQEIRRAVELGDLRENSEYKAARERQQFVQARLGQLRQRLSKLSQIDVSQIPADKVGLGSQVVVQDEKTGERESYNLVFGDSVEFEEGHVSMSSPIGKTLVGRSVGETVVLKLPAMTRRLKIIELKTIHDAA
jgi:transcription elongation factor GreA